MCFLYSKVRYSTDCLTPLMSSNSTNKIDFASKMFVQLNVQSAICAWVQTGYYDRHTFTNRKHFNPSGSAVYFDYDLFRPQKHSPQQYCMQIHDLFWYIYSLLQAMKHGCWIHLKWWKLCLYQSMFGFFNSVLNTKKFIVLSCQSRWLSGSEHCRLCCYLLKTCI